MDGYKEIFDTIMEIINDLPVENSSAFCEAITNKIIEKQINCFPYGVGDTVYAVAAYDSFSSCPTNEVIECTVRGHKFIERTRDISFSVKGRYENGHIYQANFRKSSIGKKIFANRSDAEKELERRNEKLRRR